LGNFVAAAEAEQWHDKALHPTAYSFGFRSCLAPSLRFRRRVSLVVGPRLGLKEARGLVDGAPATVKDDITKEESQQMKKLEAASAVVDVKGFAQKLANVAVLPKNSSHFTLKQGRAFRQR